MDPIEKQRTIDELHEIFEHSGVVVVAHYAGLTVEEMQDLRSKMRNAGGAVRVAKNRLARTALEGTNAEGLKDYMSGLTILAYSEDAVSAVKVIDSYAEQNKKFVVLGGAIEGSVFEGASIGDIASMPSRDELISSIVGSIGQPAQCVVGILSARDGSQRSKQAYLKEVDPERQQLTKGLEALLDHISESVPYSGDLEIDLDVYDKVTLENWN